MDSLNQFSANAQSIAERGLSSFLQAIAESAPGADLQKASDRWICALETTAWNPGQSEEKFVRQVTINALAISALRPRTDGINEQESKSGSYRNA